MNARDAIIGKVRKAIADIEGDGDADQAIDWVYGQPTAMPDVIERFAERSRDYDAQVVEVGADGLAQAITDALTAFQVKSVVTPP
ncbi:MAG: lactate utilization protein C, partial [Propionibacteriaceae bacterium]|nr:lactate utilization protein C [Propionibacteriaceae bacterium]